MLLQFALALIEHPGKFLSPISPGRLTQERELFLNLEPGPAPVFPSKIVAF
jgi:hypothetical protein